MLLFASCSFFEDGNLNPGASAAVSLTSLKLNKTTLQMKVGGIDYLSYTYSPNTAVFAPEIDYDKTKISVSKKNTGLVITALEEGQADITISYGNLSSTCIITINGYEANYTKIVEPYIYSNTSILQLSPGSNEKVFVSLYGGDAADINSYTWTCEDTSVCSVHPTGQYCIISAKTSGYTRIKVTHTKATYPYYMGVYVFDDLTKTPYITTSENILSLNSSDGDKSVNVSIVNGKDASSAGNFSWQVINESSNSPISLLSNGSKAVVTPRSSGVCTIRVTHPEAPYPLDVLCRVITYVENVYIQPDTTLLTLSGDKEESVTCKLENIKDGEYSIDGYTYSIVNTNVAKITASVGNTVYLKGVANGSTKLVISHEKTAYTREVLLISTNQLTDAIDSTYYITTSQNYIKTKVGADSTALNVRLKGCEEGAENNLNWSVKHSPADGVSDVIRLETPNGSVFNSRSITSFTDGISYITPLAEGTAVISVTHPDILYPTEILVKVLSKDAILEEPLYLTGSGLVRLVNDTETSYTVGLKGNNLKTSDVQNISWAEDDSRITLIANENTATIKAPSVGTGQTISHINITHPKVEAPKSVLVLTADTEEELMKMKALYSDKLYYNICVGEKKTLICNAVGFEPEGESQTGYDFSLFRWTVQDPSVISIERNTDYPLSAEITALKSGTTKIYGSLEDCLCEFTITVYPEGAINIEPDVYFTTSQNVHYFSAIEQRKTVSVTAVNLSAQKYTQIQWTCEDDSICTVIPNGTSATFIANKIGETVVEVSHPDSQNTLKLYVKIGEQYVNKDSTPVIYISSPDVLTMLRDDNAQKLQATLVNNNENLQNSFSFSIDNTNVAKITNQSATGIAFISPVSSGQAEITITNTLTSITKKVLVVVGNSSEELAGFTYLTTESNVVTIGEGNSRTVNVSVKNSDELIIDGYSWSSSDNNIVSITPTGSTAVLKANSIGVARVTVTNSKCKYALEIIVQVIDPIAAAANPYIQLSSSVLVINTDGSYTNVVADLIGGNESDYANFVWSSDDSNICSVYGQNEVGKLKGVSAGQTFIRVSNPKARYQAQLLVVCEEAHKSDCYISVPSSILTMKPNDGTKTITATLINGTATDKYNFNWSLDVYDIIDFQYSANVCTITPKQTGTVTINISHPKAEYDQQVIVTVSEYTTFAFPDDSYTITQGDVKFISMQVPTTSVKTHVEYYVNNSNICSITGTKNVAQITAINTGTTTVTAKLIANNTGVEQASAEMMVYVKEKPLDAAYITSTSTIYTVVKGKSQSISANITGTDVQVTDQNNLRWTTNDTDIISVTGISSDGTVVGHSIYVTALKSGEAIITCSHEKAASALQFYVVVPGTGEKTITLNKSYATIVKGSGGTTLTATIENKESNDDYNNIIWSSIGANGVDGSSVARVMGSGASVQVYPVSPGEVTIYAQLPDSSSVAKCTIVVEAGKYFAFETTALKVAPFQTKTIKYTVSPPNAIINWTRNCEDDYWDYKDLGVDSNGNGAVEVTGIKEGNGLLMATTDGGAAGKLTAKCSWSYEFTIKGNTSFNITPEETVKLNYIVSPPGATLSASGVEKDDIYTVDFYKTSEDEERQYGEIIITPLKESVNNIVLNVSATNPINGATVGGVKITGAIRYPKLHAKLSLTSKVGNFSELTDGVLKLGDGEQLIMKAELEEEKVNSSYITGVRFVQSSAISNNDKRNITQPVKIDGSDNKSYNFTISDPVDEIEKTQKYRINRLYVPYVNGVRIDWKNSFYWCLEQDSYWKGIFGPSITLMRYGLLSDRVWYYISDYRNYKNVIASELINDDSFREAFSYANFTTQEDVSYRNVEMDASEFQSYAWLYFPGTPSIYLGGGHYDYNIKNLISDHGTGEIVCENTGNFSEPPHIFSNNVDATEFTAVSTNTNVVSSTYQGYIEVTINHCGQTQTQKFEVYSEIRECPCN